MISLQIIKRDVPRTAVVPPHIWSYEGSPCIPLRMEEAVEVLRLSRRRMGHMIYSLLLVFD